MARLRVIGAITTLLARLMLPKVYGLKSTDCSIVIGCVFKCMYMQNYEGKESAIIEKQNRVM